MIENNCLNLKKKRFEYIDAMRGIAILFIVFGHISLFCYGVNIENLSSYRGLTSLLQLPMFFFVSGFVFNPQKRLAGNVDVWILRLRQLVVPALFFCAIYLLINNISIYSCVTYRYKYGYWFTFTLFEFIIIQSIWEFIINKFNVNNKGWLYIIMYIGMASLFYILSTPTIFLRIELVSDIIGIPFLRYYMFFVLGRLINMHLDKLIKYKYRDSFISIIVFGFILLSVYNWCFNVNLSGIKYQMNHFGLELFALLTVFVFLYKKRTYFSSSSRASKAITFTGRRTLDIYLLHYFFLPKDLSVFGHYFVNHPAPILELAFCGIVTILVVAVCLIVSEILRQSTFCRKWLLGAK